MIDVFDRSLAGKHWVFLAVAVFIMGLHVTPKERCFCLPVVFYALSEKQGGWFGVGGVWCVCPLEV